MLRALVIGVAAQLFALHGYSWLAITWPDSPAKYLAVAVLVVGSVWAVWLLHRLPTPRAVIGMAALSVVAPLVPLTAYVKGREILASPLDAAAYIARGFAMAFVCYAVVWLILTAQRRLACRSVKRRSAQPTDFARGRARSAHRAS